MARDCGGPVLLFTLPATFPSTREPPCGSGHDRQGGTVQIPQVPHHCSTMPRKKPDPHTAARPVNRDQRENGIVEQQIGMRLVGFGQNLSFTVELQPPCKSSDSVILAHLHNWCLRNW